MAFDDILLKLKMDASQALSEMDKMKLKQEGFTKSVDTMGSRLSAGIDKVAVGFSKLGLAIAGIEKVVQGVEKAFEFARFAAQMESFKKAIPTETVLQLKAATGGMVSEMELLRIASKRMVGDFKLTEDQMKLVFKRAQELSNRGFGDMIEIADRMAEAIQQKKFGRLDDFDIQVRQLGTDIEKTSDVWHSLAGDTAKMGVLDPALEQMKVLDAEMQDMWNKIKSFIGERVQEILSILSSAIKFINKVEHFLDPFNLVHGTPGAERARELKRGATGDERSKEQSREARLMAELYGSPEPAAGGGAMATIEDFKRVVPTVKVVGATGRARQTDPLLSDGSDGPGPVDMFREIDTTGGYATAGLGDRGQTAEIGVTKKDGFDSALEGINKIQSATDVMTGGLQAAVDAAISGNEGIGKAFIRGSSMVLKAKATEWAALAVGETALGFAALAFGPIAGGGAAFHFKAAAGFAAAAAMAGVGGAALGAIAGSAPAGAASSSVPGTGNVRRGGGDDGGTHVVINIGHNLGDGQKLGEEVQKALDQSKRAGRGRDQGSRAVRFD